VICNCAQHQLAYDASPRQMWNAARKAEAQYAIRLRKVAVHIGDLVRAFASDDPIGLGKLVDALKKYATMLEPWARAVGRKMVTEIAARDMTQWHNVSRVMGRSIAKEVANAPTGKTLQLALEQQVQLITSLPVEAAQRVHDLAIQGLSTSARPGNIVEELMRTGLVTKSRATLIARTETGRVATEFVKARANYIGSTEFIWRTAKDADVRPSHRLLEGKTFKWDQPPECDKGHYALPGCIWNCRCFAEPVIPEF
jgi:SPP1 gp7 family putative phage head morphogenesis protein